MKRPTAGNHLRAASMLLALVLAATAAATDAARIFRYTDAEGNVVFSDTPPPQGATEVELPPLQTIRAPSTRALDLDSDDTEGEHPGYQEFKITSPGNDETVRNNAGNVDIKLSLQPGLLKGDTIDYLLDGRAVGSGKATSVTLTKMDRGSHTIEAIVRDSKGKLVAQTQSVTFHLLRVAAGS